MAIPIIRSWKRYFLEDRNEGIGSSYERTVLNMKLDSLRREYEITSALEVPTFGFTGLSGINSIPLAKNNVSVHLIDNDLERLELTRKVWKEADAEAGFHYQHDFESLPFKDKAIDLGWNFAAIWFVKELNAFLRELTRVTSKVIFIGVPNRTGLGYLYLKTTFRKDLGRLLQEDFIISHNIIRAMRKLGWCLRECGYIDCPPWPDIGMAKEDFLKFFGLGFLCKEPKKGAPRPCYSIMDFYSGKSPEFEAQMLKYTWLEKYGPKLIKSFWAHHRYLVFQPLK